MSFSEPTNPVDRLNTDDRPLNLEQDELILEGRASTCQPDSSRECTDVADPEWSSCCCSSERELLRIDFQSWVQ